MLVAGIFYLCVCFFFVVVVAVFGFYFWASCDFWVKEFPLLCVGLPISFGPNDNKQKVEGSMLECMRTKLREEVEFN
jgi:hypothetical protein